MRYEVIGTHAKVPDIHEGFHYIEIRTLLKMSYKTTEHGGLLSTEKGVPYATTLTGSEFMELKEVIKHR